MGGSDYVGLPTLANSAYDPHDFTLGRQPTAALDNVAVGIWLAVISRSGDGSLDGGIDGVDVLDPQPRDSTITFLATELGLQTLTIRRRWTQILPDGSAILIELEPIGISVNVVPEPGTGLLVGLGLLALSNRDRS